MPEQLPQATIHQPEQSAREVYRQYKGAARSKAHWDMISENTFRNVFRKALIGDSIEDGRAYADNRFLRTERASRQDLENNFKVRVNEAVQDATNAGVELNLSENPAEVQVAANVRTVEAPHQ